MTSKPLPYHLTIHVETAFVDEQSAPAQNHFVFAYTITIRNLGTEAAKLMRRHWVLTDGDGKEQEIIGDGVMGEQPLIEPGQSFTYTSSAVLSTPVGSMEGRYHMETQDGRSFSAEIPAFRLADPALVH